MREVITNTFEEKMNGLKPYDWQLDVAEALILGLDCVVIARTGAGKSMPFVMPLFVIPDKLVIIISPLNALEEDQVSPSNSMIQNCCLQPKKGHQIQEIGTEGCRC
jgi:superfamily II DNA helicase RecQ